MGNHTSEVPMGSTIPHTHGVFLIIGFNHRYDKNLGGTIPHTLGYLKSHGGFWIIWYDDTLGKNLGGTIPHTIGHTMGEKVYHRFNHRLPQESWGILDHMV